MDRTICHNEVCTSKTQRLKAAEQAWLLQTGKDNYPHPQMNKSCSVLKQ
jgi:hypothetical protein